MKEVNGNKAQISEICTSTCVKYVYYDAFDQKR